MLKYEQLENEIINLKKSNSFRDKERMYRKILEATKEDFDKLEVARDLLKINSSSKYINSSHNKLIKKFQNLFQRKSVNFDGNESLESWLLYIEQ